MMYGIFQNKRGVVIGSLEEVIAYAENNSFNDPASDWLLPGYTLMEIGAKNILRFKRIKNMRPIG